MDFLRSGKLVIPKEMKKELILEEARFFCIDLPQDNSEDSFDTCILEICYNEKGWITSEDYQGSSSKMLQCNKGNFVDH